jgi:DNA-binding beta-propeller fold protein YncE
MHQIQSSSHSRREFFGTAALLMARAAFAGSPQQAQVTTFIGTGRRGVAAEGDAIDRTNLDNPFFAIIGPDGGLYFSDFGSNRVLRADLRTKKISIVAGNGTKGYSGDGGPAKSAQLAAPHEVRFDSKGNLYVDERDSAIIRRVDMKSGIISTVAGIGKPGYAGDGGPATQGQFNQPHGIVLDRNDNLYVCDPLNNRLRRVDAKTGILTTFAGNGGAGRAPDTGSLTEVPLAGPRSLEITADGKWYLALREGNSIYSIDPGKRTLKRIAGTHDNGYSGDGGPALAARFGSLGAGGLTGPKGLAISGDGKIMFVADCENHVIRKIDLKTGIISTLVGTGERGDGPDGDPLKCKLSRPHAVFVHDRTLYISDSENHRIRTLNFE